MNLHSSTANNGGGVDGSETTLLVIRQVQVFRIPPRTAARGYRASDWDVTQHLWSGRLKVVGFTHNDSCLIKLEDTATGQLFAQCNYTTDGTSVESVLDSSRYFVLKIEDPASGKHAFIGLGFQERTDAFDFNVALQDHVKHVGQRKEAAAQPLQPKADYTLKPGTTLNIQISSLGKKKTPAGEAAVTASGSSGMGAVPMLPPPGAQQPSQSQVADAPSGWVQF